jgi:(2Fe-2S) ferredoxin
MSYPKFDAPQDLERFRKQAVEAEKRFRARVLVCTTGCRSKGALEIGEALRTRLASSGLEKDIAVIEAGCHGQCSRAPAVVIEPWDYLYGGVSPEDVDEIIETTLRQGKPVERLCEKSDGRLAPTMSQAPFYRKQRREVLAHCGRVDPKKIEDAIARGTYAAAAKALSAMKPESVIDEVREAGIRGPADLAGKRFATPQLEHQVAKGEDLAGGRLIGEVVAGEPVEDEAARRVRNRNDIGMVEKALHAPSPFAVH